MNTAAVAAACHALGAAVDAGVVVDKPSGAVVYGGSLPPDQIRDLAGGLSGVAVAVIDGDNVAVRGYLLGLLTVQLVLPADRFGDVGDLPGLPAPGTAVPGAVGAS